MRFGKWLVEARISQKSFAKLLATELGRPVFQPTISRLAAEKYVPSIETALAIKKLSGGLVAEVDWMAARPRRQRKRRAP